MMDPNGLNLKLILPVIFIVANLLKLYVRLL